MVFPNPTHSKYPERTGLKPWIACRNVIKLDIEGESIFGRLFNLRLPKRLRKALVESTLKRIAYGIKKFLLEDFISKSYSSNGNGIDVSGLHEPLHTIRTNDCHAYIKLCIEKGKLAFITQNIQMSVNANSINDPLPTILTRDEKSIATLQFIDKDNQNKYNVQPLYRPLDGIVCADSKKLISVKTDGEIDELKELEKRQFIETYFSNDDSWDSFIEAIDVNTNERIGTVDLLCNLIKDIKMRYLHSNELAMAMGFREDMYMGDTETERKLHIGNAVTPVIPEAWSYALTS